MSVYDCFQYCGESDLLELRLNELDHLVDYVVLTEAPVYFSGLPKPLYFEEEKNEPRFKKFEHKIIHQIITDTPDDYIHLSAKSATDEFHRIVIEKTLSGDWWPHAHPPYGRDTFLKECALRGLTKCKSDDIIMLSDVDEIANADTLKLVLDNFDLSQVYNLKQKQHHYYFNIRMMNCRDEVWLGNMLLSFEQFKVLPMCLLKIHRRGIFVANGGNHFSYMGGREKILEKMVAGNETQLYTDKNKSLIQTNLDHFLTRGCDMYGTPCNYIIENLDETYPKYLRNNLGKFKNYVYRI